MSGKEAPPDVRFWRRVERTDDCWLWTGGTGAEGYGRFQLGGRGSRIVPAHRFAYELLVGPIPPDLHLDHLCRVAGCVNPAHLEPVTPRENQLRGQTFAARNAAQTHCPQGHPYDETNTYVTPRGHRDCRTCRREAGRRARARRKTLDRS